MNTVSWLMVGLGNPGSKYAHNRHNVGFMVLDMLLHKRMNNLPHWHHEHQGLIYKTHLADQTVYLLKPQTYMNLSGESVQSTLHFYKIPLSQLVVIQDDIDLPFGTLRFQTKRGHGGHNGIRSISQILGTNEYTRLKWGVGRPPHPSMEIADYVLQNFSPEERERLNDRLVSATDALVYYVENGYSKTATKFNSIVELQNDEES